MGTPIPNPPNVPGSDCGHCTPGLWPSGYTPKYIYAYFAEIVNCGIVSDVPPNGQTFKLEQSSFNNCLWLHFGVVWNVEFQPDLIIPDKSQLRLSNQGGFSFFSSRGDSCPAEYYTFANDQASCILSYAGSAGTCTIFWSEEILELINGFGFLAGPNLFYELFNSTSSDIVHKFCDLYQRTNLKIKVDH